MSRTFRISRISPNAWMALAAAVLVGGGYFAFHHFFVRVSTTVESPFTGRAASNPYYVLQRYLDERGIPSRVVRRWPQPLEEGVAVFWFSSTDAVPSELRRWLGEGGQLWAFKDPDSEFGWDWEPTPWFDVAGPDGGVHDAGVDDAGAGSDGDDALVDALLDEAEEDVDLRSPDAGIAIAVVDHELWRSRYCGDASDSCLSAAQFAYGNGCLTLVTSADIVNDRVHREPTPGRLDSLLRCPTRPTSVLIVSPLDSPWFGQLLVTHAPAPLLACAVLMLLWLWRSTGHLGRELPPRNLARRHMMEHIEAVGTLAGRTDPAPLIEGARRALRRHLTARIPGCAELEGDQLVEAVASATRCEPADVRCALTEPAAGGPQQTLAIARAVQALWRKT